VKPYATCAKKEKKNESFIHASSRHSNSHRSYCTETPIYHSFPFQQTKKVCEVKCEKRVEGKKKKKPLKLENQRVRIECKKKKIRERR
jgi:hypothetical protein